MMIPAFLIANALGSVISENVMQMCGQNKYTMLGLLLHLSSNCSCLPRV